MMAPGRCDCLSPTFGIRGCSSVEKAKQATPARGLFSGSLFRSPAGAFYSEKRNLLGAIASAGGWPNLGLDRGRPGGLTFGGGTLGLFLSGPLGSDPPLVGVLGSLVEVASSVSPILLPGPLAPHSLPGALHHKSVWEIQA